MMPLLPYFLVYLSGILAALPAAQNFLFPWFLSLATAIAGAFLFIRSRPKLSIKSLVLVLLFPLGFSAPGWQDRLKPEDHIWNHLQEGQYAVAEGWVEETPTVFPDKVQYRVHLEQITYKGSEAINVTGTARITLYQPDNPLRAGDRLRFNRIKLKRPRNFKNPGRFDYVHYIRSQGIDVLGGLSKAKTIERLGTVPLGTFTSLRGNIRERMLLTGDITERTERYLVAHTTPLQAGILKVPHHGSRTSSHPDFIRAVGPKDVIVSSGRFNAFHHPHPAIVDRYGQYGATLWRTDLQGAIRITTDGNDTRITDHKGL